MSISIISSILSLGIIQIFFVLKSLSGIDILSQHKRKELNLFLILLSFSFLNNILFIEKVYEGLPFLFALSCPIHFFLSPLFFIYILKNTYPTESEPTSNKKHFIFPVLIALSFIPFYFLYDNQEKFFILTNMQGIDTYTFYLFELLIYINAIQNFIYIFLVFRRINIHEYYIKENFSDFKDYSFIWIKKMILLFIIIILFTLVSTYYKLPYFSEILMVVWVLAFNWQLLVHLQRKPNINEKPIPKIKKSIVTSDEELKSISIKLESVVNSEKLYLNPTLSLEDVSMILDINRQKLSEVLNQYMDTSFYDYINHKRIETAKKLLLDTTYSGNILMVSLDSGFKSRSVFYNSFKKNTKMTPSEYKKINLQS